MRIDRDPTEQFHGDDAVEGEHIGVALSHAESGAPVFAVTIGTPVGGRVYYPMDAVSIIEYASEILRVVSEAMHEAYDKENPPE